MNHWRKTTTTDLIASKALEIGDGYRAKNDELGDHGLPFARAQNINGGFNFKGADRYPQSELRRVGLKISQPGDCVITTKGSVGRVAFVAEQTPRFVYSPQLSYWRSFAPNVVYPRFLRYWLEGPEFLAQCAAVKSSTDMADYVNLRDQRRLRITLPTPLEQHVIGDILGGVDDLIENNRRRIELLEQMAQAIYREWFMHFRYPGHEDDTLVDSLLGPIPGEWEVRGFSDIASYTNGFAFKPTHWHRAGLPIIKIKELKNGIAMTTPRYNGDDVAPRYRIGKGDLLFSWSADLDAYLWPGEPALLNQHLFKVAPLDGVAKSWLYFALRERMDEFRSRSQGTTMKHIKRAALAEVSTVVPSPAAMTAFAQQVEALLDEILELSAAAATLESLRDLLLPKLVTGAIDVSRLDLDALLAEPAA